MDLRYFPSVLCAALGLIAAPGLKASIALDVASNYASWTSGSNEGFGFGAWTLTSNGGSGFAGAFIGNPSDAGLGTLPNPSFGLFANPDASGAFSNADRSFANPLAVGHIFSLSLGINFDSNGTGNKGLNIYSGGIGGTELININMGGSAAISINGNAMFANYGTNPMNLSFQLTNATTLRVFGNGRDGIESYDNSFTISGAPDSFRVYASDLEPGDARQPYFNNLQIVPEPSSALLVGLSLMLALGRVRRNIP